MDAPLVSIKGSAAAWSLPHRIAFRFVFAYFALYAFPLPAGLADPDWLSGLTGRLWGRVVPWVAQRAAHVTLATAENGSGDRPYDYALVATFAALALLATVVWSILDRRRPEYRTLHAWARVWLRYALAFAMVTYGMVKVIKLQFPAPYQSTLAETYGESSPMGLLWTFMGYSTGYTFFAGAGECLGALLLFFRRTATLGALVVIGVMSNVVMLNFCYDVPVKLGSSHLLVLAVLIAAPDLKRLFDLLVANRPTQPRDLGPVLPRRWMRVASVALKAVVLVAFLGSEVHGALESQKKYPPPGELTPPDGYYAVTSFVEDGQELPTPTRGGRRWKTFVLKQGHARVWWLDRQTKVFVVDGDPSKGHVALLPMDDDGNAVQGEKAVGELDIAFLADGTATAEGTFDGRAVKIAMTRQSRGDAPLLQRGFHWVSDEPFNR